MKKKLLLTLILIISFKLIGQINPQDSTVQVIGYWDINDKESFQASYEKYTIKNSDTTYVIQCTYEVDITVKDSTENSYDIEWYYKNYDIKSENEIIKKLSKVAENMSVIIKTDEYGAFIEVKNWEQIKKYIDKSILVLKEEYKSIPNIDKILEQTLLLYNSKEAIEANAIKDIHQFYTFHGGKYLLNETLTGNLLTRNNYGEKPFDTKVEVILDEIDVENDDFVLRSYQVVDSEQLTEASYNYVKKLAEINGQNINKEDVPILNNQTWVASRIHGSSGWTIYSIMTKEVSIEDGTEISVEETIIQLK